MIFQGQIAVPAVCPFGCNPALPCDCNEPIWSYRVKEIGREWDWATGIGEKRTEAVRIRDSGSRRAPHLLRGPVQRLTDPLPEIETGAPARATEPAVTSLEEAGGSIGKFADALRIGLARAAADAGCRPATFACCGHRCIACGFVAGADAITSDRQMTTNGWLCAPCALARACDLPWCCRPAAEHTEDDRKRCEEYESGEGGRREILAWYAAYCKGLATRIAKMLDFGSACGDVASWRRWADAERDRRLERLERQYRSLTWTKAEES